MFSKRFTKVELDAGGNELERLLQEEAQRYLSI
jgi:hypothetical protein